MMSSFINAMCPQNAATEMMQLIHTQSLCLKQWLHSARKTNQNIVWTECNADSLWQNFQTKVKRRWAYLMNAEDTANCKLLKFKHAFVGSYIVQFTQPICTRQDCLVLSVSVSVVWTELATSQDCRKQKILKLFCPFSKCGVNRVLSCLDPVSNLQLGLSSQTRSHRIQDWTKLFSLHYIENYWKQSRLVTNSVHITDTDKTRQTSLVLSVWVVWTRHKTYKTTDLSRMSNTQSTVSRWWLLVCYLLQSTYRLRITIRERVRHTSAEARLDGCLQQQLHGATECDADEALRADIILLLAAECNHQCHHTAAAAAAVVSPIAFYLVWPLFLIVFHSPFTIEYFCKALPASCKRRRY